MSELVLIHRTYQSDPGAVNSLTSPDFLLWETCRRRIYFADQVNVNALPLNDSDEIYQGLEAEEFLIEVLCGLRSPLVGETEVFGQFKIWWQALPESDFKKKYSTRVQLIYAIVKRIREEALYGLGSQSYGSLLRKKIGESGPQKKSNVIDFVGAGQLVQEMIPWVQKKWSYRIWCRDPEKARAVIPGAAEILPLSARRELSDFVVVAAPLGHAELNAWIRERQKTEPQVFDFRHDSMSFKPEFLHSAFFHLDHFSNLVQGQKQEILKNINRAYGKIESWKQQEQTRAQVRPFGWDDL